ncbi:MAG: dihydrofolate reductase family protein [Propionibacteriales bacterium]|nr:dihydrofolate reductase family protein [Propionibacteriales bacterium]
MTDRPRARYVTATTLDGFLADERDSLDWLLEQDHDPDGAGGHEHMTGAGALVMGATTYRWVVDHLAETGEPWPYEQPTFVFTHRELATVAPTVRVVAGDPAGPWPEIVEAADGRDVWVVGGGALAADLAEAGLLDEVIVSVAPVTLGAGRPLFPRRFDLRLRDVGRNRAFVVAHYDVVGPRAG